MYPTKIFAAFILTVAPCVFAQDVNPNPQIPEDAFSTRQLIAWSDLQRPQPAPQPIPPRDTTVPQLSDQQAPPPTVSQAEETAPQSFTGKILSEDGKCVLRVGDQTYRLNEQDGVRKFEDRNVNLRGQFNPTTRMIRVLSIEVLP